MRLSGLHVRICVIAAFVLALAATPAAAVDLPPIGAYGANGDEHVEFLPFADPTHLWADMVVANAGDVDGDGNDDVATEFTSGDPEYRDAIYVIFSNPVTRVPLQVGNVPLRGFKIQGERLWFGLTSVGDVNDDGYGDLAFVTYDDGILVVYGKPDNLPVDTSEPGSWGFKVRNVRFGVAQGYSSSWQNTTITGIGDQNGDGRRDLAFRDGEDVKVVFTDAGDPDAALDADALGDDGYTLATRADSQNGPYVGDLGDVNGDGRGDLAVGTQEPAWRGDVRAYGVTRAGAGETIDLEKVADDGRGFEWHGKPGVLENMTTVGDQNGDGRREVALITHDEGWRKLWMPFSPEPGSERDFTALSESEVETLRPYSGNVIDVGDQNDDGFGDLAVTRWVAYAGPDSCYCEFAGRGYHFWPIGREFPEVATSLGDMDGDGRREIVVASVDGVAGPNPGPYFATYAYDVYYSRPRLQAVNDAVAKLLDSGDVRFDGSLVNPEHPDPKALVARAHVQIAAPDGGTWSHDAGLDPAGAGEQQGARVDVPAAEAFGGEGLRDGVTYSFRMIYESEWGTLALGPSGSFTYRRPSAGDPPASDPVLGGADPEPQPETGDGPGPAPGGTPGGTATTPGGANPFAPQPLETPALGLVATGTPRADRLTGGPLGDRLLGGGGRDVLVGASGKDLLDGGPGDDKLVGGAGRDRLEGGSGRDVLRARDGEVDKVSCGPGRDVAVVDRIDRVKGCERTRR